ncbi:hypothetical protein EEL31_14850 [Brevibacillus laterosporus]|nr:hypothetical protein [Brevibacillus laterosporus]TPG69643.1 hypothetical protein EEL31_14850 [Brevibacillus laterosporus]
MRINSFSGKIIIVLIAFVAIIAYFTVWPWVMIFLGSSLLPNPPRPEVAYGEFPFRLEYEINGQRMVIQDTLICEYDGIGADEGRGKYRKWKERLASGNEEIILLKVNDTKEIDFFPGSAEYYMGDLDIGENDSSFPNAFYVEKDDGFTTSGSVVADQLLKEYNIKLISWDYTQPIKNNFSTTKK